MRVDSTNHRMHDAGSDREQRYGSADPVDADARDSTTTRAHQCSLLMSAYGMNVARDFPLAISVSFLLEVLESTGAATVTTFKLIAQHFRRYVQVRIHLIQPTGLVLGDNAGKFSDEMDPANLIRFFASL